MSTHSYASAGTPVNQFGTPITTPGASAAHTFESNGAWSSTSGTAGPGSSAGKNVVTIAVVLVLVVAGGVAARHYVFPDRHKPVALPATLAGMPRVGPTDPRAAAESATHDALVRTSHGAAVAAGVFLDPGKPNQIAIVSAGRLARSAQDKTTTLPPFTELGKVTCTQTLDPSATATGTGSGAVGARTFTDRAVCWRETRALTVAVIVVAPSGNPVTLASQAVADVWDAQ
ncbi:hypothetical protein ACPPVT_07075 [Angustibacter sp. McL0619]|uniref:hypothetical protein n=1 Tax=Angustibacter sp. McL0619 TaxID=3415676 RepID=UPI003CFA64C0